LEKFPFVTPRNYPISLIPNEKCTPKGHSISDPFRPEELAAALRHLKQGKSQGLDSILPEFILHSNKLSNPGFAISLLPAFANSKFQRSGDEQ